MSKIQYCLTHEVYELGWTGNCLLVNCPPPSFPEDWENWIDSVDLPDAEELALMDKNAEELSWDFFGELK